MKKLAILSGAALLAGSTALMAAGELMTNVPVGSSLSQIGTSSLFTTPPTPRSARSWTCWYPRTVKSTP